MTTFKRSDPFPFEFEVHSTARVGAVSVKDKLGRELLEPLALLATGAAIFAGKRLVFASTCELHPKYQALRPPRSKKAGCTCAEIYLRRNEVDAGR